MVICGKILTHIAGSAAEEFRAEILQIAESSRQTLQSAMKAALMQEQQQQHPV